MEIQINKILNFVFLSLPLIGFFSFEIIDGLGLLDIYLDFIFLFILLFSNFKLKLDNFIYIIMFLGFNILSILVYYIFNLPSELDIVSLGFLYKNFKFVEIFLIFNFVNKFIDYKTSFISYLESIIFLILVIFILWTFFYIFFLQGIVNSFISPRVSFPFSDYQQSNAHLFAYCFGFVLASYVLFNSHNSVFKYFIILISILALQFTGSRNYILAIIFPLIIFYPKFVFSFLVKIFVPVSVIFLLFLNIYNVDFYQFLVDSNFDFVFDRVYSTDFTNDSSSEGRITKFLMGLDFFLKGPIFIGLPLSSTPIIWFDGIIPSILVQFGFFGFLFFIFILVKFYFYLPSLPFKFLYFYIVIGNLITEFIYVSRGLVFSVLLFLFIFIYNNRYGK